MSVSSSTVISESNPRSPTSVCAGLIASAGNALIRATEEMIVFATFVDSIFCGGGTAIAGAGFGVGTA